MMDGAVLGRPVDNGRSLKRGCTNDSSSAGKTALGGELQAAEFVLDEDLAPHLDPKLGL